MGAKVDNVGTNRLYIVMISVYTIRVANIMLVLVVPGRQVHADNKNKEKLGILPMRVNGQCFVRRINVLIVVLNFQVPPY